MDGNEYSGAPLTLPPGAPIGGTPPAVPGASPNAVFIPRQFKSLDESNPSVMPTGILGIPYGTAPVPADGSIHPRLRRPLNRTHSAPLPLGPHLMGAQALLIPHPQQQQAEQIRNQKMFINQRIKSAVLQRVGSKNHMENVDEEGEVKVG